MKRFLRFTFILIVVCLVAIVGSNRLIESRAKNLTYSSVDSIPENLTGIILGTAHYLVGGGANPYFEYRIDAASELYRAGKIHYLIVSGDNSVVEYNEPREMMNALIDAGVPSEKIYLDYAGFRTFDSMIRAREIFGQTSFTVISQQFQNERAIYIGLKEGMHIIGYNARDVDASAGFKTNMREYLARVKMIIDLYLIPAKPHFLGEKIHIGNE